MKGFFKEEQIRNQEADQPWTPSTSDRAIELYLAGTAPQRLAHLMQRTRKSIARRFEQYTYNEDNITERYQPHQRISRQGKRFTQNEVVLLKAWKKPEYFVTPEARARFLCRNIKELGVDAEELTTINNMKTVGSGVDLVLAHRYLQHCKDIRLLTPQAMANLEAEEQEFGARGDLLKRPPSTRAGDYPEHIKRLAMYLVYKHAKSSG